MILVGIGANIPSAQGTKPEETCIAALQMLARAGADIVRSSPWFRSLPVPISSQPEYINGVVQLRTSHNPTQLLALLHNIEQAFGRSRDTVNAPRELDLDLLAFEGLVARSSSGLQLPHPRLHQRAFVLEPLVDLDPDWRHPLLGLTASELLLRISPSQILERITGGPVLSSPAGRGQLE
jgi:2-amino-4-hydroxy-6-hydroxymethyldihydropteridine diphosphokinase